MTDHPMIFSAPMILAILREAKDPGTGKTQTRRIIKPQPHGRISMVTSFNHGRMEIAFGPDMRAKDGGPMWWRPLAQPGDRVWCRERAHIDGRQVNYAADAAGDLAGRGYRPSIHMPRWASRLTLYVSEVRVQRLQDICEADARAEGAYVGKASGRVADNYATMAVAGHWFASARGWYADLWERLNGPGSWQANPFVAAYTFRPVLGNIDTLPETHHG